VALSLDLTYTSESPDEGNYIGGLTDSTVYSNTNPDRNEGVVYLYGSKIKADGLEEYPVDITDYDPITAEDFEFTILKDGWYQFKYVFVPNYDGATQYFLYDAVYSSGVVYRAILDNFTGFDPTNASYWEVIPDPVVLVDSFGTATVSANVAIQVYNIIIYPFAKKLYGDKAEDFALKCCGTFKDLEEFTEYKVIGGIVAALKACNTRQRYASGEKISQYAAQLS
jgi:hypothetical protein